MGGLLLKLLKITCCDCISQPQRIQSEDESSSSCLSSCPWTWQEFSQHLRGIHPSAELLHSKGHGKWGHFPPKLSGCQPSQAEAELTQVLRDRSETFSRRCCRRQKIQRAKIMNGNPQHSKTFGSHLPQSILALFCQVTATLVSRLGHDHLHSSLTSFSYTSKKSSSKEEVTRKTSPSPGPCP